MTRYQLLLLPTLAASILVLGGALNQKPAPSQPPLAVGPSAANHPEAVAVLDQAIAALAPERVAWLETKVWQQIRCEDFAYRASGRLVTAPGDRMRFDLNVVVGKTLGELRLVNDGQTLWQSIRIAGERPTVQSWGLPVLDGMLKSPAEVARARAQLLQEHSFSGLEPMLRSLRKGMQSAQVRQKRWNGHDVHIVSAAWPEDAAALAAVPDFARPRFQLRQSILYLDAQTLWPHRIEWWGTEKPNQPNELLTQTEYRNPVLNQPLSDQRRAGEFTYEPEAPAREKAGPR